ncbi:hypothetical protein M1295_00555 [Patescibacteria group bacterium]|nr:hypothetical protein [Patescibacteria group bacterium]
MWKQWVNVVLGLVEVVAAYMAAAPAVLAIVGLVIAILALWSAVEKKPGAPAMQ